MQFAFEWDRTLDLQSAGISILFDCTACTYSSIAFTCQYEREVCPVFCFVFISFISRRVRNTRNTALWQEQFESNC